MQSAAPLTKASRPQIETVIGSRRPADKNTTDITYLKTMAFSVARNAGFQKEAKNRSVAQMSTYRRRHAADVRLLIQGFEIRSGSVGDVLDPVASDCRFT